MPIPIGLQLYSLREDCAQDLLGTIRKVADMGYQGVEFAGFFGHRAEEIKRVLDASGIVCCGSHCGIGNLNEENWRATLEFHEELECPFVIVPGIPPDMRSTLPALRETCALFTELAARVESKNMLAGYHAHYQDLTSISTGERPWYEIAAGTPDSFVLQYDTSNGKTGGADPVQPMMDFPGRGKSIHLKSFPMNKIIGEDEIPWTDVLATATLAGTEWFVVEHEEYDAGTPLECVQMCLSALKKLGFA
ncbi:sugar phosphate isomerase/epimerase [Kamptonema cortianum]|nr:sugar phosphate isomerase/epimerase [Geitlerinema splendidum]MDK3156156.1 sugar phosphate isomerase/epimerase [Kamptonema cortianum]